MKVLFHPEFPQDIRKFERDYRTISDGLASRFRREIDDALEAIKLSPQSAGHFLQTGSNVVTRFADETCGRFHSSSSTALRRTRLSSVH